MPTHLHMCLQSCHQGVHYFKQMGHGLRFFFLKDYWNVFIVAPLNFTLLLHKIKQPLTHTFYCFCPLSSSIWSFPCIHLSLLLSSHSLDPLFHYLLLYCFCSLLTLQRTQFKHLYLPSHLPLSHLFGLGDLSMILIDNFSHAFCVATAFCSSVYNLVYVSYNFSYTTPNPFLSFCSTALIIC